MPSPISILDSLPQSAQDTLISWIEAFPLKTVLEKVAAPPPEGFGIQTHITSLRRFYARAQARAAVHDLEVARERLASGTAASADFQKATLAALMQQAFQWTADAHLDEAKFRAVAGWLVKVQQQEIELQKLQFARERLELQRRKLEFAAKCKAITAATYSEEAEYNSAIDTVLHGVQPNSPKLEGPPESSERTSHPEEDYAAGIGAAPRFSKRTLLEGNIIEAGVETPKHTPKFSQHLSHLEEHNGGGVGELEHSKTQQNTL